MDRRVVDEMARDDGADRTASQQQDRSVRAGSNGIRLPWREGEKVINPSPPAPTPADGGCRGQLTYIVFQPIVLSSVLPIGVWNGAQPWRAGL